MTDTLRGCIVAEPGYTFLGLDASQLELRVLALLSQDKRMLLDLATGDLHMATALRMFGHTDDADLIKKRRYDAKQCNFAVVYGADAYKLAQMFECSLEEAEQFMADHKAAYPRMYEWMEERKAVARELGYVLSMFGRKRPIPNLTSSVWKLREDAEREVVNTEVQGTAIDIIKMAMLVLRTVLDKRIRLVLNVHDEILWECPDELLPVAIAQCQELPNYFPDYPFKLVTGKIYGEMKELEHG